MLKEIARKTIMRVTAKIVWRKIKKSKGSDTLVFVNFSSIGDTLYGMAYLSAIKEKENKKIHVIAFEQNRAILQSFNNYDELTLIPKRGIQWFCYKSLVANIGYSYQLYMDGIIIHPWGIVAANKQLRLHESDYLSAIRAIFQIDDDAPIQYHNLVHASVSSIENFEKMHEKIVILNPYSASVSCSSIGISFFEKACRFLTGEGYIVYTNTIKNQRPIKGSLPLRCGLEEMLSIAEEIPLIVSLRSGILDLLVKTNVNMFVVYNRPWHYDWYRIGKWHCSGNYREVLWDERAESLDALYQDFIEYYFALSDTTSDVYKDTSVS